jgi:hypothetical protein
VGSVAKELGLRDSVLRRCRRRIRRRRWLGCSTKSNDFAWSATFLKKVDRDLCWSSGMRFRFIEDHRSQYPVTIMCRVLDVSPAGYYGWRKGLLDLEALIRGIPCREDTRAI